MPKHIHKNRKAVREIKRESKGMVRVGGLRTPHPTAVAAWEEASPPAWAYLESQIFRTGMDN